ncbi:sensor histidine kinase [Butyrivibrio sp. FC2001]|uniref:sensor histidine kinase n=1 Tax=Butyrivibrio sp. FC2001 TaxID=1280671 RepID=UPI0003F86102|nr:HAMP domain-containing sensor histidine kinase [Butyrivibrio sp. FC2001]
MVKKLRRKFVLTATLSLLVILIGIIGFINGANYLQVQTGADDILHILAENNGMFPDMNGKVPVPDDKKQGPGDNPGQEPGGDKFSGEPFFGDKMAYNRTLELPFQSRYFWVKLSETGKVTEINTGHIAAVSSEDAESYAKELFLKKNKTSGYVDKHYRYLINKNEDGSYLILFADCSNGFYNANRLLVRTLLVGLIALIAMFILVYLFSGKAVAPVVESLEKQKRFITDAGHELKTPLAVISANIDVIELENGKSEWTKSTKNQIKRLDGLVKNLLTLSRMEEENINLVFSNIEISKITEDCTTYFNAMADYKKINYTVNIEDNIHINGDKAAYNQLCTLLIDNAMKYTPEEGSVDVSLKSDKGMRNAVFEVANTCEKIPEGKLDRLFDRFYRADTSRSRESGGHGIGLSVARAIATSHGGSIEAKADNDKRMRFIVTLPLLKSENK